MSSEIKSKCSRRSKSKPLKDKSDLGFEQLESMFQPLEEFNLPQLEHFKLDLEKLDFERDLEKLLSR